MGANWHAFSKSVGLMGYSSVGAVAQREGIDETNGPTMLDSHTWELFILQRDVFLQSKAVCITFESLRELRSNTSRMTMCEPLYYCCNYDYVG